MQLFGILIYNLVLVEFLAMAVLSWAYNGLATRGTGKLFGPFALLAAAILISGNIRALGGHVPMWALLAIWTVMALMGLRAVVHMALQAREARRARDLKP